MILEIFKISFTTSTRYKYIVLYFFLLYMYFKILENQYKVVESGVIEITPNRQIFHALKSSTVL